MELLWYPDHLSFIACSVLDSSFHADDMIAYIVAAVKSYRNLYSVPVDSSGDLTSVMSIPLGLYHDYTLSIRPCLILV